MFSVKILADSTEWHGGRITTMELTYPRCIHAEFMTHRMFSRNAASSRAIPVEKMLMQVEDNPFIPLVWGTNQPGMVAAAEHEDTIECTHHWLAARNAAVSHARYMHNALGLHKQILNRIVEPWMWITVICSGVDHAWENFFKLRCAPDAEPHIAHIAYMARDAFDASEPRHLGPGMWHLPLISVEDGADLTPCQIVKVATARCARVSYLTHDGKRDPEADIALHDRLAASGHWSPFEHVAMVAHKPTESVWQCGNLGVGWVQYRKLFENEYCERAPR